MIFRTLCPFFRKKNEQENYSYVIEETYNKYNITNYNKYNKLTIIYIYLYVTAIWMLYQQVYAQKREDSGGLIKTIFENKIL